VTQGRPIYCAAVRVLPEPTCRTTGSLPSADVHVMALFEPANSMLAPLPKATITVLFEPTISSHLQAPVRVSVVLLPRNVGAPAGAVQSRRLAGTGIVACSD